MHPLRSVTVVKGQDISVCDLRFMLITCLEKNKTIDVAVAHSMVSKDSLIVIANSCIEVNLKFSLSQLNII
ncbi:hypothetical protein DPMN_037208 [Dreissena polymorpha]|uniref:Uncharacterized protein n=1 Tax=Dreissena polymorpha TaxID=45954 RepID=A0A9D4MAI3_DREPO|nr:hypothetical protein DPMN_037208 [Dreissena polymorpha]